jgi:hypothetical protein
MAVTQTSLTPAMCGSRTRRSTEPGHDKHMSPCDNDTTDFWKNSQVSDQELEQEIERARLRRD